MFSSTQQKPEINLEEVKVKEPQEEVKEKTNRSKSTANRKESVELKDYNASPKLAVKSKY